MWSRLRVVVPAVVVVVAACQQGSGVWFRGTANQAIELAGDRETLVMLEFYTDWCSWCRRMDRDTFADPEVVSELKRLVPVRVNAEKGGEELAERYGVDSYPTFVFVDDEGEEVDRILGYLPPEDFLSQTRRIRTGDTFMACLYRLAEDPTDLEALSNAVSGLLERSDPEGAIARIKAYHRAAQGHSHEQCVGLMFRARAALHSRLYSRAAKLHVSGWSGELVVPDTDGTRRLHAVVAAGVANLDPEVQAERLRSARHHDAAALLGMVELDDLPTDQIVEVADFAFRNGHYDRAAEIYGRWYRDAGERADPDDLNTAAWQLYLAARSLELGLEMARQAYEQLPTADVADTVARLLYVTGDVDSAKDLERWAADTAPDTDAPFFNEGLRRMEAGQDLGDRPAFEGYPGTPLDVLAGESPSVI